MISRREFLSLTGVAAASSLAGCTLGASSFKQPSARVVVVGGGFGGLSAARTLRSLDSNLDVTLIEPKSRYISCPYSNLVIAGERNLAQQTFSYDAAKRDGIRHIQDRAINIDPVARQVALAESGQVGFDRLILAPGIRLNYEALPGYSEQAAMRMPHAWQAGDQTALLAKQLAAMRDGGTVAISVPANPYRCPPGPYERASLIAHYLKRNKPRSKVLILDAKDQFSKQKLFVRAWRNEYPGMVEWQGLSDGARVIEVDANRGLLQTDFDQHQVDVANVIPPQQAGKVAVDSGLTDASGWCPVDALSFESTLAANIHVIGDAAILNQMPKSAFAANAQAKLCAVQIVRALGGESLISSKLMNTCYSLIHPQYGISVADVYQARGERWQTVAGAGGVSPANADMTVRQAEAKYADGWFETITNEVFR